MQHDRYYGEKTLLLLKMDMVVAPYMDESQTEPEQGALVATIATTAFAVPNLDDTHWTARAFLVWSLLLSLVSVFTASRLYKTFGRLLRSEQLVAFISIQMDVVLGNATFNRLDSLLDMVWPWYTARTLHLSESGMIRLPSAASCLLLSVPRLLFSASLVSFVLALGAYLGGLILVDLPDRSAAIGDFNVAIFYLVAGSVTFFLYDISSSILAGRTAGAQDAGDRIMTKFEERRRAALAASNAMTEEAYKAWYRRQAIEPQQDHQESKTTRVGDEEAILQELKPALMANVSRHASGLVSNNAKQSQVASKHDLPKLVQKAAILAQEQGQALEQIALLLQAQDSTDMKTM